MDSTVDDPLWWRATIILLASLVIVVGALVLAVAAWWLISYVTTPYPYNDPEPNAVVTTTT